MAVFGDKRKRAANRAKSRAERVERLLASALSAVGEDAEASKKLAKLRAKTSKRHDQAAVRLAELELAKAREGRLLSTKKVKRALSVARLLAPVAVPLAYRAATGARSLYDNYQSAKANRLASPQPSRADRLAALSERIELTRSDTAALVARASDDTALAQFQAHAERRLKELAEAVATARRLSAPRRVSAQRNIVRELDELDTKLLEFRNVPL
ncbi:conserved hypothetical protein [Segniliparus rotundus DSM 44985]|uniref:Uncharacterized protein n=1 Tax=Segniliparus rotundus (strain ATCC BAA-972 / CDC 1076 / CIP 108378 / DSM 44985 / JCM 13578) TaxID=640132 RepID=D6ZDW7_SEGRD|nr:DUF6474 family protein [Segniliparus rotundus]ADG99374.1 conserved hypothetical protein [Segniliparus rotundus DSM 44985]